MGLETNILRPLNQRFDPCAGDLFFIGETVIPRQFPEADARDGSVVMG